MAGLKQTKEPKPSIDLAYEIASMLWEKGFRGPDGLTVIGMAMGIYLEAQEGAHRNLEPINDALLRAAKMTFDAMRAGRDGKAGTA